jgi:hypothetical protein
VTRRWPVVGWLAASAALVALTGCANRLAFGTVTKFGLDVSQRPDQTVEMTLGYDRAEVIVIPTYTAKDNERLARDATAHRDTYSVLGTFQVTHGNPFANQALIIHQFFATGRAAAVAAEHPGFQEIFGREAGLIYKRGKEDAARQSSTEKGAGR